MPKPGPNLTGLADEQATQRLHQEGYNERPKGRARMLWRIPLEVGSEPMFQLLIAESTSCSGASAKG
jgi:P-type Ca2+ transporter type 2C